MSGGITSGNFTVSLVLALFTAVCWGSWSNFFKTASVLKVPFPIFYLDFSLSIAVVAGVAFVTLFSFCKNDKTSMERVLYAVLSGLVFNGGNVLLIYGIETVGLAVAFPIGVGLGLVGGTILTYLVDPHGVDEYLLFSGVGLAFIAVLFNAYASGRLENQRKRKQTEKEYDFMSDDPINSEPKEYDAGASLFACVCAGAFITAFPTFSTFAAKSNEALGPYGIPLVSNGAVFVSSLIATIFASFWYPKAGLKAYFSAGFKMHIWGFLGDNYNTFPRRYYDIFTYLVLLSICSTIDIHRYH